MSNVILHKRSSIPSGKPALSLPLGEVAVNTADGVLFTKKNAGSDIMVEFHGSETPHLFRHQGTVSNPAAGYVKLYPKADNNFYKRTSAGVEAKLWDSGNHGADSGLDADMLDGQHASAFALQYHTHTNYVAKSGDTMSGDLSIIKSSSMPSVDAYYRVAAQDNSSDASQAWFNAYSSQGVGNIQIYGIRTVSGTPTTYSMLYAEFNVNRGNSLHLGDTAFDNLAILANTDVIGNATHVYVADVDGWVKKVPVSSFGGGGGGGTVTSVGLSMPNIFSVSGSPVTSSGTLTASLVSQTKNRVFAAPASVNGVPVFRALVAEDIPDLSSQYDFYYSWNMKVNSGSTYQILKTGASVYSGAYNGINMIAGNGIEISESSVAGGAFGITIASLVAHNDSSTVTYASSTAVATGGTFTAISNRPLPTPGTYLVLVQIMCSFTSAANNVQAKIFNGSNVYASTRLDSALNDTTNKITTFYAIVQTSVNNHYVYLSATASVSGASVISNTGISSNGTVMSYIKLT